MTWYEKIISAHTAVTTEVSHHTRMNSERYFVWQEEGKNDLVADNRHVEGAMVGTTDLFTKEEFDPWVEAFQNVMDALGISWVLSSVQYEEDTGFIHYEWTWEVLDDGVGAVQAR